MCYYSKIYKKKVKRAESAKSKSGFENQMHKSLEGINRKRLPLKEWQKDVSIFIIRVKDTEFQNFFCWDSF